MEHPVFESRSAFVKPALDHPGAQMTDLYAAAAARIIVTSKKSFVTSCGVKQFTGEVMAIDYIQPADAAVLEAAVLAHVDCDPSVTDHPGTPGYSASTIFDPDVLLAWLLTEGVITFQ